MMSITWSIKKFDALTVHELYAILQLRNEVFVVEQQCVFQDADDKDQCSHHIMGWQENKLVAYTRIVPPVVSYSEPAIGRVVTSPAVRGSGIGRELMERSVAALYTIYGHVTVRIGAQLQLEKFYQSLGFVRSSDIYLEDGIEHIQMVRI